MSIKDALSKADAKRAAEANQEAQVQAIFGALIQKIHESLVEGEQDLKARGFSLTRNGQGSRLVGRGYKIETEIDEEGEGVGISREYVESAGLPPDYDTVGTISEAEEIIANHITEIEND